MKFDDLDSKMHQFETAHDFCVLPVKAVRRVLHVDLELPMKEAYETFMHQRLKEAGP